MTNYTINIIIIKMDKNIFEKETINLDEIKQSTHQSL